MISCAARLSIKMKLKNLNIARVSRGDGIALKKRQRSEKRPVTAAVTSHESVHCIKF